jgi:hypothetical protein
VGKEQWNWMTFLNILKPEESFARCKILLESLSLRLPPTPLDWHGAPFP